jgi:hypothetical protein
MEKTIFQMLETAINKKDFEALPGVIGITEKKWTRLKNQTDSWEYCQIKNLVLYLLSLNAFPDIDLEQFILIYGFESSITLSEIKELKTLVSQFPECLETFNQIVNS